MRSLQFLKKFWKLPLGTLKFFKKHLKWVLGILLVLGVIWALSTTTTGSVDNSPILMLFIGIIALLGFLFFILLITLLFVGRIKGGADKKTEVPEGVVRKVSSSLGNPLAKAAFWTLITILIFHLVIWLFTDEWMELEKFWQDLFLTKTYFGFLVLFGLLFFFYFWKRGASEPEPGVLPISRDRFAQYRLHNQITLMLGIIVFLLLILGLLIFGVSVSESPEERERREQEEAILLASQPQDWTFCTKLGEGRLDCVWAGVSPPRDGELEYNVEYPVEGSYGFRRDRGGAHKLYLGGMEGTWTEPKNDGRFGDLVDFKELYHNEKFFYKGTLVRENRRETVCLAPTIMLCAEFLKDER